LKLLHLETITFSDATVSHLGGFIDTLDVHLARLSELNCHTHTFLDLNINLLRLHETPICTSYLDAIITNGFLQIISKATRIQNNKASLIDHILTNANLPAYTVGTIIDDLSDHFMNFIQLQQGKPRKIQQKESTRRHINEININNLKNALNNTDWATVYSENTVDSSFNAFWGIFKSLYDEHFPIIRVRFNKNKHKINGYMTDELLNAHKNKLALHKTSLKSKALEDHNRYIAYRNYYNTLLANASRNTMPIISI
jgi:predicted transcriptional regulator